MTGILVENVGAVGYLTLTKSETLNAITQDMVDGLRQGLHEHENNPLVKIIVLRSASERAFCAGGDMKRIRQLALGGDKDSIEHFFTEEYALNLSIANCSKPYISLIDGVAMGGGLGLSVHGQFVVVSEHALMAMPESRIGFFPDVGASFFLQNLTNNCGTWFALTAAPLRGAQAVHAGLATHSIKRDQLPALLCQLETFNENNTTQETESTGSDSHSNPTTFVQSCLNSFSEPAVDAEFTTVLQQRERWFSSNNIETIKIHLSDAAQINNDAKKLLNLLEKGSPHSYAITLALFEKTKDMSLKECLATELSLSMDAAFHPDLAEGVRAVLVDKDHSAKWQ